LGFSNALPISLTSAVTLDLICTSIGGDTMVSFAQVNLISLGDVITIIQD
jgi:hypothetical protein